MATLIKKPNKKAANASKFSSTGTVAAERSFSVRGIRSVKRGSLNAKSSV